MIKFNSKLHTYELENEVYTSVSTLIGKYKRPFMGDHYSKYKAYERILGKGEFKRLRQISGLHHTDPRIIDFLRSVVSDELVAPVIKEILGEWENKRLTSIKKGNDYHTFKEQQALRSGVCINPYTNIECKTIPSSIIEFKKGEEVRTSSVKQLIDLEDGFHPECMLWNSEVKIAGQADLVFIDTIKGVRYIDIDDHKTNKEIKTANFYGGKMLSPLDHLGCCNYNHYRLQISAYAWLLEQGGFTPRYLGFTHLNKPYRFEYMKKEIESIIPRKIKYDF